MSALNLSVCEQGPTVCLALLPQNRCLTQWLVLDRHVSWGTALNRYRNAFCPLAGQVI